MTDFESIDWLGEVSDRKEDLLNDLFHQLRIDSVRNDEKATEQDPVGPGPRKAMEEFLRMAERDGFETKQFGPWAGRVEIGEGNELLGILGHVDVVPVGSGWNTDPFEPQIIDGKIYARGASDDKGPMIAAYHALKLVRDLGVPFNKRVHLIVGTDEESDWQCMDYYFQHAEMPTFGFSPDAYFPIINGEKGNASAIFDFEKGVGQDGDIALELFQAGLRSNMVPEKAQAILRVESPDFDGEAFIQKYNQYLDSNRLHGEATFQDKHIQLDFFGKSAHGSTPEKGVNAGTHLASFLSEGKFTTSGAQNFIDFLASVVHEDFKGEQLGIAHTDALMGDLSANAGLMNYSETEGGHLEINLRYPQGTDPANIEKGIYDKIGQLPTALLTVAGFKPPHYVPGDDPLVETLLDVYSKQTGRSAQEQVIGGGTYARLMPRGVAYGALFPDSEDTMHQANEYIAYDDLLQATAIYAEAIYRLTR